MNKFLILLVSFVLAMNTMAAAPLGVLGQSQSAVLYPYQIKAPASQVTDLGSGKALVEIGNTNLLSNPGFEHITACSGWTTSVTGGATASVSVSTSNGYPGENQYCILTCTTSGTPGTCSLKQEVTTIAGAQGFISALLASGVGNPADSTDVYTLVGGVRTTNLDFTNTGSTFQWREDFNVPEVSTTTSLGIEVVLTNPSSASLQAIIERAQINLGDLRKFPTTSSVNWYTSISQAALLDGSAEIRFPTTNPFTKNGDSSLLIYTDDSANTRTKFVAASPIYVIAALGSPITTTNASLSIRVNGSTYQLGSQIRTANDNSTVTFTGFLNTGDFLTFDAGSAITTGANVYASITAISQSMSSYSATCGANCLNDFVARISDSGSTGVISQTNTSWITTCTESPTGTYACPVNSGVFSVLPSCVVSSDTTGSTISYDPGASTTTSLVFKAQATLTGILSAGDFAVNCSKTGADAILSRIIIGSFKEVMTAPGITKPKTCYYKFGGSSATLASPTECTSGTCVEVEDSCNSISAPARSAAGKYTDLTLANGSFANSSPIHIDCVAFDTTTATPRDCTPTFVTGDQTWSTTSSGGAVLNLDVYSNAGTDNDAYVVLKIEGQAP